MRVLLFILMSISLYGQSGTRPNIVFMLADDLGQNEISRNGNLYQTPNIDYLCNNGAYYERFYVQEACSQTRAAFMTGRYPWKFGLSSLLRVETHDRTMPEDTLTISQELRELGYVTGIVGKWHLGDEPWARSRFYDFNYSWEQLISAPDYYLHSVFEPALNLNENGICQDTAIGTYGTDLIRDKSIAFIENMAVTENPFFLYVPFTAPHSPWQCGSGTTNDEKKDCMMTELDNAVGAIHQAIINAGIEDNTLIVFGSDNGGVRAVPTNEESNLPYRGYKGQSWEGAINVPFTFYWKNTIPPTTVSIDKPVHIIDLLPTFVDLAGGTAKPYIDGVSMLPFGTVAPNRLIYCQNHVNDVGQWIQVIAYNEHVYVDPLPTAQVGQIYDLSNDIGQTTDLIGSGLPIESFLSNAANDAKAEFRSQPYLFDNMSWVKPRCYGHEHRRDDYYKDEYVPLIFVPE